MAFLKTVNGNLGDGHFLIGEYDPNLSGDSIVLAPTAVELPAGTALGKVTATGLYVPYNPAASDGSQTFACLLFGRRPISAGNQRAAGVFRKAVANFNLLTWVVAANTAQQNAAIATAATNHLMIRK